jgi:ribosome assembly protein YihI (activator of Der GTPase)
MTASIQHFLLIYDHAAGRLLDVEKFGVEAKKALARYEELEQLHRDERQMDIVLVGSDSLDTVKVTHANYFDEGSLDQIEDFLRKVAERHHQPGRA